MRWAPTRNTPPASSQQLRDAGAKEEAAIEALRAEDREIREALPLLLNEPTRYAEGDARLREIEALLPSKRRTLEAITRAIPEAERREDQERRQVEVDERQRKSGKLRRDLKTRYTRAAEAFAEVLRDIQEDNSEWHRLQLVTRGLNIGDTAEHALRREFASASTGLTSLTEDVIVRDWTGRPIFRG